MIKERISQAINLKQNLLNNQQYINAVDEAARMMIATFRQGGKVLFCGNGGSAADSQHIAAELSGRFFLDRKSLYAEALHVNSSYITSVANDYCFDDVYMRMTQAAARKGDILVGLSTSGNSENVVRAMQVAKQLGVKTISFTGQGGGRMKTLSDCWIEIPSTSTPRIQECHILTGHIICEIVEKELFSNPKMDKKYLFLDRDGVINRRIIDGYVTNYSEFEFIDGVKEALEIFDKQFDRIFIVTNQQGIGKGLFTQEDFDNLTAKMLDEINLNGGRIDKVYMCPDLKTNNPPMRKPNIGMALQAQKDFPEVDLSQSIMVGDSQTDMQFGKNAGMYTIFIDNQTGDPYDENLINEKYFSLLEFAKTIK